MKELELRIYEIVFRGTSRPTALSVNLGHSEIHWMDEKYTFLMEKFRKSRTQKSDTLKKEVKSLFLKKNELEGRVESM